MNEPINIEQYAKPHCVDDEISIKTLLNEIIDRLEKSSSGTVRSTINENNFPELFMSAEIADDFWTSLQTLFSNSLPIFYFSKEMKYNENDSFHAYIGKNLLFKPEFEMLIRKWVNRPKSTLTLPHWKALIDENAAYFPGEVTRLRAKKIIIPSKTFEDILQGFIKIDSFISDNLTLRNLSAKCFWQNSKFLDKRLNMLEELYPQIKIKPRIVLVNVYLPDKIQGVLFVENLDNYHQAIQNIPQSVQKLALVYSAGFKLSARTIREKDSVSLHFHQMSLLQKQFTTWWLDEIACSDKAWPVYFWGDLDYAGMDILKNLKQRFTTISAWQPGYQPMRQLLIDGEGHTPEIMGKEKQQDRGDTGCNYADTQLMPVIRKTGHFVDQECIT